MFIDESEFETVVIIRKNRQNLKGSKYCHPGFYDSLSLSDRVLTEFERYILSEEIPNQPPNPEITIFENDLQHLANFFGKSCRPGTWVQDEKLNDELRKKIFFLNNKF